MSAGVSHEKTESLREALYCHTRQVRDYFDRSIARIESYDGGLRRSQALDFAARAGLLVSQLDILMRSALRVKALRASMNLEQLEAVVHDLYARVQEVSREIAETEAA